MYRLICGKYQIVKLDKGTLGSVAHIDLGNSVIAKMEIPLRADVRLGDYLTLYTEVPIDANFGLSPEQQVY